MIELRRVIIGLLAVAILFVIAAGCLASAPGKYYDYFLKQEWSVQDIPWFLRDFQQFAPNSDPIKRVPEIYRWLKVTKSHHDYDVSILWGQSAIEKEWTMPFPGGKGKKVRIIYTEYSVVKGEVVCNYSDGVVYLAEKAPEFPKLYAGWVSGYISDEEYYAKRKKLSWQEFNKIDVFLHRAFIVAENQNWKDFEPLQEYLVDIAHKQLGIKNLFQPVPWQVNPPLTVAEVLGIPVFSEDQYFPDVIYYGPIKAWGYMIAGSNVLLPGGKKPERRMGLNEGAIGYDWILGTPQVIRHELVHSWQSFPLAWWYDCELFNEAYSNCLDVDEMEFLLHSYLKRIRKIALRYWSFDADKALSYIITYKAGGVIQIDRDRYEEMAGMVHKISTELKRAMKTVYQVFYSDPLFFISLSDIFRDPALPVDLIFAQLYEPTCLGGVEATQRWQVANAGKIADIGKQVMEDLKKEARDRYKKGENNWSIVGLSIWNNLPLVIQQQLSDAYQKGGMKAVARLLEGGAR